MKSVKNLSAKSFADYHTRSNPQHRIMKIVFLFFFKYTFWKRDSVLVFMCVHGVYMACLLFSCYFKFFEGRHEPVE